MDRNRVITNSLVIFLFIALTNKAFGYMCDEKNTVCETMLEITTAMTMFHPKETAVFPKNGLLFRYNVTNTSQAKPVPVSEVITADGWERQRVVIVANGTLPGPDIIVYEGQTLIIHVVNKLYSDTVSIHWHGLPQRGSPYMDGVGFVTQCPVQPGQTFTYTFQADPKGTYWYHSHVGAQRAKGLYGALIIRERNPPPLVANVADEFIMQLQGWNHDYDVDMGFLYSDVGVFLNRKVIKPSKALDGSEFSLWYAQSGLINGKGRYYDPELKQHNEAPLEIFSVEAGKSYRFRLINAGAMYPYRISIDNHPITVIASDGYFIHPITVESLIIHPGERYDFIIYTTGAIGNYWIRGHTLEVNRRTLVEAILHYKGAEKVNPRTERQYCTSLHRCRVLNCPFSFYPHEQHIDCVTIDRIKSSELQIVPKVVPGRFREYFLNFAFPGPNFKPDSINGVAFLFPQVSAISQPTGISHPCSDADCGEQKICECTHSLTLRQDDTIQFVFLNMGRGKGWSHPIHMHGHSFQVLKMGYGNYDHRSGQFLSQNSDINCGGGTTRDQSFCNDATWSDPSWKNGNIPGLNEINPPQKDTVIVPSGGYVVVRIKADNPGLWILHCHIQLHSADGMSLLLNESFSNLPPVPENFPTCQNFYGSKSDDQQRSKPAEISLFPDDSLSLQDDPATAAAERFITSQFFTDLLSGLFRIDKTDNF